MISHTRLQDYMRQNARQAYESVAVPPFSLFFHPTESLIYFNYAIPDAPVGGDLSAPLARLRQEFLARGRRPRFEFLEEYAPALASALLASGFEEEGRYPLLVCTPEMYQPVPDVAGLTVSRLTPASALQDAIDFKLTQSLGFGAGDDLQPLSEAEARAWLDSIGQGGTFLARLNGQAVSAGNFSPPLDGLSEIAGISTPEAFRRQGFASALTSEAVRVAFEQGVEMAFLSAGNEAAARVYERIGFRTVATFLNYSDPVLVT
jgi:GNAT superfamily N-acetyltransferase